MECTVIARLLDAAWPDFPVPSHHRSPAVIAQRRIEMERIAAPVRELFTLLEAGEAWAAGGEVVMRSIDADDGWMAVVPALGGWLDCVARLAPDLPRRALAQLARFLAADLSIPPSLVVAARAEFDAQALRVAQARAADVRSAVVGAQLAWEFERLGLA